MNEASLIVAMQIGSATLAEALALGLDPNRRESGTLPIVCATRLGSSELVSMLLRAGAVISQCRIDEHPLHIAAESGNIEVVRTLVEVGRPNDLNIVDDCERTPLAAAAVGSHLEVIRYLAEAGANIDFQDAVLRETALHEAVRSHQSASVRCLIEIGADTSVQNHLGKKAIDLAYELPDDAARKQVLHAFHSKDAS